MSDSPEVITIDGVDALRSLGAPAETLEKVATLIEQGREVTATISTTGEPASVALLVDGEVVATFNKPTELQGEDKPQALIDDPRLEYAPIIQDKDGVRSIFLGRDQLIQVLLARGIYIPKGAEPVITCKGQPLPRPIRISFPYTLGS